MEYSVPSATARRGAPSGAKMSSPWCQPPGASGLGAPKLSPNEAVPYTGNTYPPVESRATTSGDTNTGPPGTVSPAVSGSGARRPVGRAGDRRIVLSWPGRGGAGNAADD